MTNKKHILFLPKWYPNKIIPLNGNFIECHAQAVATLNQVTVLFVRSNILNKEKYEVNDVNENGIRIIRIYFKKPRGLLFWTYFFRYFKAQKIGYQRLIDEKNQPDITHVHVLKRSAFFARFLQKKYNIPFLISEHWSGYTEESLRFKGILNKVLTRWIAGKAHCITTVSDYLKQAMQKQGINNKYHIIPNAVNIKNFNVTRRSSTSPMLIHISTLEDEVKNVSGIIRTLKQLKDEKVEFHMHVIGDGRDKLKQEKLVKKLNLESKVTFHGDIAREVVAEYLKKSKVLVIFSNYETQSVVMLEAMCCGIPVISTEVGGIPEYLNKERGILIKKGDENALKHAIKAVLNNEVTFDEKKISKYAIESFSLQEIGKQFDTLYNEMLH